MTWSYSGDPTKSDLDMVRFTIGDTEEDTHRVTDEEIRAFLNLGKSVKETALICLQFMLVKLADECDYKIGPEQVTASQRYKQTKAIYDELDRDLKASNIVPQGPQKASEIFNVGMQDNRRYW